MIKIDNVSKKYNNINVLKNVSFEFNDNEFVYIIGDSGSGKSTLLNIIGTLNSVTSGSVSYQNTSYVDFSSKDLEHYRSDKLGVVFQERNLIDGLNAGENIRIANPTATKKDVEELLLLVGLPDFYNRKVYKMSTGQKQRVSIARALINNPDVILADEPTAALDYKTAEDVNEIFKLISATKLVIVVSHEKEDAYKYGNKVITLADGEIVNVDLVKDNISKDAQIMEDSNKVYSSFNFSLKILLSLLKNNKLFTAFSFCIFTLCIIIFSISLLLVSFSESDLSTRILHRFDDKIQIGTNDNSALTNEEYININNNFSDNYKTSFHYWSIDLSSTFGTYDSDDGFYNGYYMRDNEIIEEYSSSFNTENDYKIIAGHAPTRINEIMISEYLFNCYVDLGLNVDDNVVDISNYDDILNKRIIDHKFYRDLTVVGIVSNINDLSSYDYLRNNETSDYFFQNLVEATSHIIIEENYYGTYIQNNSNTMKLDSFTLESDFQFTSEGDFQNYNFRSFLSDYVETIDLDDYYIKDGVNINSLKDDQIILDISNIEFAEEINDLTIEYINDYVNSNFISLKIQFENVSGIENASKEDYISYIITNKVNSVDLDKSYDYFFDEAYFSYVSNVFFNYDTRIYYTYGEDYEVIQLEVVGFSKEKTYFNRMYGISDYFLYSKNNLDRSIFYSVAISTPNSIEEIQEVKDSLYSLYGDSITINNSYLIYNAGYVSKCIQNDMIYFIFSLISMGVIILGMIIFCSYYLIKSNRHNVGILKTLGYKKSKIAFLYLIFVLLIIGLSLIFSNFILFQSLPLLDKVYNVNGNTIVQIVMYNPTYSCLLFIFLIFAMIIAFLVQFNKLDRIQLIDLIDSKK